jgi:hypothetical protein
MTGPDVAGYLAQRGRDQAQTWMADRTGRLSSESRHVDVVGRPAAAIGELFVVLTRERHVDPDVELWADQSDAIKRAHSIASNYARDLDDVEVHDLTQPMLDNGWVAYLTWGPEGDSVTVLRRPVRN